MGKKLRRNNKGISGGGGGGGSPVNLRGSKMLNDVNIIYIYISLYYLYCSILKTTVVKYGVRHFNSGTKTILLVTERANRIITNSHYRAHTNALFFQLKNTVNKKLPLSQQIITVILQRT